MFTLDRKSVFFGTFTVSKKEEEEEEKPGGGGEADPVKDTQYPLTFLPGCLR